MIIICSETERDYLEEQCDGRCVYGKWCLFTEKLKSGSCPIENKNILSVREESRNNSLEIRNL